MTPTTKTEHLLTIVEPIPGGDTTLDLAHETVARGGTANVLMVVTDRVRRDIAAYAESEGIGVREAEKIALAQLRSQCSDRVGGVTSITTLFGPLGSHVVKYIAADTTAIAISASLVTESLVQRIATYSGRPVTVSPQRIHGSTDATEVNVNAFARLPVFA